LDKSSLLLLENLAHDAGLALNAGQLGAFNAYGDFLTERNRHVNLTAISDETGIIVKHFFDSLSVAIYAHELTDMIGAGVKLADVGSGAGFPGIPLKILYGDALDAVLIDSTKKKVDFMNEAAGILGLSRCAAVHARAEDAARLIEMRGRFNAATARALAALSDTIGYCLPFLSQGGILIAMKGRRETADNELAQTGRQLKKYGGNVLRIKSFTLDVQGTNPIQYERTLVIIEKT